MEPKIEGAACANCTLRKRGFVPPYMPDDAEIMVIGEGPGYHEVQQGVPFVGKSGRLLAALMDAVGFDYEKVWRTNVVCCRPPGNREPTQMEAECCSGRLTLELSKFTGTVMPLGKVASQRVLEMVGVHEDKISKIRGQWFGGEPFRILPSWHPAYVLRQPDQAKVLLSDIRKVKNDTFGHWLQQPPKVAYVDTLEALMELHYKIDKCSVCCFDVETDNVKWYEDEHLGPDELLMLGIAIDTEPTVGYIIHPKFLDTRNEHVDWVSKMLTFDHVEYVAHNGKFDMIFLRQYGIDSRVDFDTMLAHYVLDEDGRHGLKGLATEYFGMHDYEADLVQIYLKNRNDRYSKVPYEKMALYCAWDNVLTLELRNVLKTELERQNQYEWPFKNVIMEMSRVLTDVEYRGVHVDVEYINEWAGILYQYCERLRTKLSEYSDRADFNPNSWQQVGAVLYDKIKIPPHRVRGLSKRSTSKPALAHIEDGQYEFVDILRQYRRAAKMRSTYLLNLIKYQDIQGRVHPVILIHGTEVGRISMRQPALQTVPRPYEDVFGAIVRGAFVAPPGWKFIIADYSQAELRVAAVLANEPFLLDVYRNDRDLHSEVAIAMYGDNFTKEQRVMCKMFNFSYLYGGTEHSFAADAGLPINIARQFVRDYNNTMPALAAWKYGQLQQMKMNGFVRSPFGRKRRTILITDANQEDVRKSCVHAIVAGCASDLTQLALVRAEDHGIIVVLSVHDSIGAIAPEGVADSVARELKHFMESVGNQYFPEVPWKVDYDIRDRWSPRPREMPAKIRENWTLQPEDLIYGTKATKNG